MDASYAVTWKDSEGATDSGRLALGPRSLRLDGASSLEIAYDDVTGVSVGRGTGDRLRGRTTVVLSRRSGRPIWIVPVAQHLVLLELFERLTTVSAQQ